MPVQPNDLIEVLQARHMDFLTDAQARCLAALALGYSVDEIAEGLSCSPATVRRNLNKVSAEVFDLTGVDATRDKLRTWVSVQAGCCTREVARMLENNQIFVVSEQTSA